MLNKLQTYTELLRLNKPIGTLLLLWPTLIAVVLANHGYPSAGMVFIFLCGVFLTRSAGCILNDMVDRDLDAHVARTKDRPIASGRITVKKALLVCAALLLIALLLVLFLNRTTIIMACVALAMAAVYPFFKRFTYFPQLWLGIAFNWGILMAFTAVNNTVPVIGYLLYVAAFLLTVAYDTMYGMADKMDDLLIGIKSTAILFGSKDRLIIGILQGIAIVLLLIIGITMQLRFWYYFGLLGMGALFLYQQLLIKNRNPQNCFAAFLNNNYSWLLVFIGVTLSFL